MIDDEFNEMSENQTENEKTSDSGSVSSDIIRGHINTIILRSLYDRDKYGYEIMTDIEARSHGQYTLKQPTLYSALKRLENQGYIKAYWKSDEVSSGGRRKYFKLTDSGREITEKNLAEWEYSRTIIDSLISDRSFDFSNPAPTPVDFTILRDCVSRVPVVKDPSEGALPTVASTEAQNGLKPSEEQSQPLNAQSGEALSQKPEQSTEQNKQSEQQAEIYAEAIGVNSAEVRQTPPVDPAEESRRIAHENYLRLISEPVKRPEPPAEDIVEASRGVNADSLLYNNRPETERDYKNLIDGIYGRAISNGTVQTSYGSFRREPATRQATVRLIDRGRADGVSVSPSSDSDRVTEYAVNTTYDKGKTLLKCSGIVLAILLIEAVLCFLFMDRLEVGWLYPTVILILGIGQFAVFGVLYLKGYGKNCVRPTTGGYVSTCLVLTIIAILIICALAFLFKLNPTSVADIFKLIIIPSVTALNITLFAVTFNAFVKM